MQYNKTRKTKSPTVGKGRSAGIDFYIPELNAPYLLDVVSINQNEISNDQIYIDKHESVIVLAPGAHILLPAGIRCALQNIDGTLYDDKHGLAYIAHNRSSIAKNKRLDVAADVVDEDYQGEIHFSLTNTSNQLIQLRSGEKILQFLLVPIVYSKPVEVQEDLFTEISERGLGNFGSSEDA